MPSLEQLRNNLESSPPGLVLLGLPFDAQSSYLRGSASGPAAIREALHCEASSLWTESGRDLAALLRDLGDLDLTNTPESTPSDFKRVREAAKALAASPHRPIFLGGDHSLSYPLFSGLAETHGPLTLLHVDAHPDTYESFEDNPFSHASSFARILEEGACTRLIQLGIRSYNQHHRDQAARYGATLQPMADYDPSILKEIQGQLYLSLDLDGLDPACAPGVAHHEPGGLTTRQSLDLIQILGELAKDGQIRLLGADIVELLPARDVQSLTATVAAKLVKEIGDVLLT